MTETLNRAPTGDSARGPGVDETPGPHPLTRRRPESSTSAHTTPASRLVQIPAVSEVRRHQRAVHGEVLVGQKAAAPRLRQHTVKKTRATSPASIRSRFFVNTVASQTGSSISRPTNQ